MAKKISFVQLCREGKLDAVRSWLLHSQPPSHTIEDINQKDMGGLTPLMHVCLRGHREILELLLQDERIDVNIGNGYDETAFHLACQGKNKDIVKLMMKEEKVDVNRPSKNGTTPLMVSCYLGNLEIVKWLLINGEIKLELKNKQGKTAMDWVKQGIVENNFSSYNEEGTEEKRLNCLRILQLLEEFDVDPEYSRFKLKRELGILGNYHNYNYNIFFYIYETNCLIFFYLAFQAANIFSIIVLLVDNYLKVKIP